VIRPSPSRPRGFRLAGSPVANPVPADALAQAGITFRSPPSPRCGRCGGPGPGGSPTGLGRQQPELRTRFRLGHDPRHGLRATPRRRRRERGRGNAAGSRPPVVHRAGPGPPPPAADAGPIELPADTMSPVSAAGGDAGATPMWLDTPSGATAGPMHCCRPAGDVARRCRGSAPVTTALVAPSRRVASITRVRLLTHLINGGISSRSSAWP